LTFNFYIKFTAASRTILRMSLLSERQEKAFSLFLGDLARQRRVNSGSNGTTPSVSTVYNAISCPPLRVSLAPVVNSAVLPQVPESRCNEVKLSQAGNEAQHDSESKSETAADDSGSEDEGVKRWVVTSPRKPRKITERKRADAAAFSVWLETNQKTLSDDGKPVKDQDKSVAWLLRDFQSPHIIDNPRDYQVELFEKAKQQNSIAVLDTGSYNLAHPIDSC
jgi:endoribonuclease Dicer